MQQQSPTRPRPAPIALNFDGHVSRHVARRVRQLIGETTLWSIDGMDARQYRAYKAAGVNLPMPTLVRRHPTAAASGRAAHRRVRHPARKLRLPGRRARHPLQPPVEPGRVGGQRRLAERLMADYRRGTRARRPAPADRRAAGSNGQGSLEYAGVLPGLLTCSRCAALLCDTDAARTAHGAFHDGLRELWSRLR